MNKCYVGNIPFDATDEDVRGFFGDRGVVNVKIITDRDTGRPRGFAFVQLRDASEVAQAVDDLNGMDFGGRRVVVSVAHDRSGAR